MKSAKDVVEVLLNKDTISDDNRDVILRINLILLSLESSLISINSDMVSLSWLTAINNAIKQIHSNLSNYTKNKQTQSLNNAVNQLDIILDNIVKIKLTNSEQNENVLLKAYERHTFDIVAIVARYKEELQRATDKAENRRVF